MTSRIVFAGMLLALAALAWSDSITVDGKTHSNVLITTSSNFYYVTLPEEGRVITVMREDVDPSSVSISKDPIYRDKRKAVYEQNRQNPPGKSYQSLEQEKIMADADAAVASADAPPFSPGAVEDGGASAAVPGGGASAEGLGITAAELQSAVKSVGVTMAQQGMQAGHPKFVGSAASGQLDVDAYGPEENLKHLNLVITSADIGQLQSSLMAVGPLLQKIAPWAPQWFMENQGQLMGAQSVETTQGNVKLFMQGGQSGANISLTITFDTVG